jgi:hypothetical protein
MVSQINSSGIPLITCRSASVKGTLTVIDNGAPLGKFSLFNVTGYTDGDWSPSTIVNLPGPDWTWGIDTTTEFLPHPAIVWVQHVPEPATIVMLALGGVGLLGSRKRLGK